MHKVLQSDTRSLSIEYDFWLKGRSIRKKRHEIGDKEILITSIINPKQ